MGFEFGDLTISRVYFGANSVDSAYKGTTEMFVDGFDSSITTILGSYAGGRVQGAYRDNAGNGYFNINMGGGSAGQSACVKTTSNYSGVVWSHHINSSYGGPLGMVFDANENVYIGGFHGHAPGDYYAHIKRLNGSTNATVWGRENGYGQTYMNRLTCNTNGDTAAGVHSSNGWAGLMVLDSNGNTKFTKAYPDNNCREMFISNDYAAGWQQAVCHIYTITGTYLRSHTIPYTAEVHSGAFDSAGNYYLIHAALDNNQLHISKFDVNGNKLWDRTISHTTMAYDMYLQHAHVDEDNHLLLAYGFSDTNGASQNTAFMRMSPDGTMKYFRKLDTGGSIQGTWYNINRTSRTGFISGILDADGFIFEFDYKTGGKSGTSATTGGYTFTVDDIPHSISTAAISYTAGTDPGGSRSVWARDSWDATSPSYSASTATVV